MILTIVLVSSIIFPGVSPEIEEYGEDYITNGDEEDQYGSDYIVNKDPDHEDPVSVEDMKRTDNVGQGHPLLDGEAGMHLDFLVNVIPGCTGTLIHDQWVVTAHHCINTNIKGIFTDRDGNKILRNPGIIIIHPKKDGKPKIKRLVTLVVLHKGFLGEALSWKGGDFALLKLAKLSPSAASRIPRAACLPSHHSGDPISGSQLYMSGFGRRRLPHCITDSQGPEKFQTCGRPKSCHNSHRTRKCGLEFLYQGVVHTSCIQGPTPSSNNTVCRKLKGSTKYISHIFDKERTKLVTTCYPTRPPPKSKGWCTTRAPGIEKDREPTFNKGWGFCSEVEDQENCDGVIKNIENLQSFSISSLSKSYCVDQLMENLRVEQPNVTKEEASPLPAQFCVGQNITLEWKQHKLYSMGEKIGPDTNKLTPIEYTPRLRKLLEKAGQTKTIDGGPACFGDSGGPAFKIRKTKKGELVAVIVGVFSYMLWGTCRGRQEPSYYGTVSDYLDWVYKWVPKNETCSI